MFNWNQTYVVCLISIWLIFIQLCFVFRLMLVKHMKPVYCLMVTGYNADRVQYAKKSIQNFKDKTYNSKFLIILNQSKERLI